MIRIFPGERRRKVPKYLAHVSIKPRTGDPAYTVETEFEAPGYPAAWNRVLGMADRFGGTVVGHKLQQIAPGGELVGTASDIPSSRLPVVSEAAAQAALTVNAIVDEEWYDCVPPSMLCPSPRPYPISLEEVSHDSAA
jgi:hypothetical protein